MSKKLRIELNYIIAAFVILAALMIIQHATGFPYPFNKKYVILAMYLVPYFLVGIDVVRDCIRGIMHVQLFDEAFLMTLATVGAFATGEYAEAVAVMLFYQVGEWFQRYAVGKSRRSISDLMDIAPEFAYVEGENGEVKEVEPEDVQIGDILVIRPGDRVPVDGEVISGDSMLNTAALTGESVPRRVKAGDRIISGCINGEGLLRMKATKKYEDSTVAKVLELVENATEKKSKTENFITRFAKVYTPIVVIAALILAVVPTLIYGNFSTWIMRACTFLVISCPCALVISIPLAFFSGVGAASEIGVLVKGSNYLEIMSELDTLVTDKTGTLTRGDFEVTDVIPMNGYTEDDVLRIAASLERTSSHPIATSIMNYVKEASQAETTTTAKETPPAEATTSAKGVPQAKATTSAKEAPQAKATTSANPLPATAAATTAGITISDAAASQDRKLPGIIDISEVTDLKNIDGKGLTGMIGSDKVFAGNAKLLSDNGIAVNINDNAVATIVYVAMNDKQVGTILISDSIKPEAKEAISALKSEGVKNFVMLTGDLKATADAVANELGINEVHSELLPQDKIAVVEELIERLEKSSSGDGNARKKRLAFVGDGINDAPVLARADIGIAMGAMGSDAAIEAADIVIMDDNIRRIPMTVALAKRTVGIAKQNIWFALGVKGLILVLGAIGIANMWMAVFADVGVAMICILNSMRLLKVDKNNRIGRA